jgi:hypothetical protein
MAKNGKSGLGNCTVQEMFAAPIIAHVIKYFGSATLRGTVVPVLWIRITLLRIRMRIQTTLMRIRMRIQIMIFN